MEATMNELERWMKLRYWEPPPGCPCRNMDYTRTEAISILEGHLVRLREAGGNQKQLKDIEAELMMHYRDMDGEWDDLPLSIAAVPGIWRNLTLMHLYAFLDEFPDAAVVAGSTDIDQSVLNAFFCHWTPLQPEQVLIQSDRALVFLGEPEVSECQVRSIPLPHWARLVGELIVSAVIVSGQPVTTKELQESVAHCIVTCYLEDLNL